MNGATPRSSLAVPGATALAAFVVLIGLGTWQLERKTWKEGLIAALQQRLQAEPVALPPPERWARLDAEHDEFRRVTFTASIAPGDEGLVYAAATTLRQDVSGIGYWVFAPAKLADGKAVVVNRGFVPENRKDPTSHPPFTGAVQLTGALRWPETRGLFTPGDDPAHNLWFARDHDAIAAAKKWGAVAPFYIELEAPSGEGDLPHAARLTPTLRNEHLQYALTWYGLAIVLAVIFAVWVRRRGYGVSDDT